MSGRHIRDNAYIQQRVGGGGGGGVIVNCFARTVLCVCIEYCILVNIIM